MIVLNLFYVHWYCRCLIIFLKEHGREIYNEVKATYIDTMSKVNVLETLLHSSFINKRWEVKLGHNHQKLAQLVWSNFILFSIYIIFIMCAFLRNPPFLNSSFQVLWYFETRYFYKLFLLCLIVYNSTSFWHFQLSFFFTPDLKCSFSCIHTSNGEITAGYSNSKWFDWSRGQEHRTLLK